MSDTEEMEVEVVETETEEVEPEAELSVLDALKEVRQIMKN